MINSLLIRIFGYKSGDPVVSAIFSQSVKMTLLHIFSVQALSGLCAARGSI